MGQDKNINTNEPMYEFPSELLNKSIEERKRYFKDYTIKHKFLEEAISRTVSFITSQVSERIILVCGPSGVGKKELIEGVKERMVEIEKNKLVENRGVIPVVSVEAVAPEQGSFNFSNLWKDILTNLEEPMIDDKISYGEKCMYNTRGQRVVYSVKQKADYQQVLQNALKYRNVKVLIINEAHHMLMVSTGKKVNWSVNILKSLVNGSQTTIVLVGTYSLLTFIDGLDPTMTDQIIQRTKIVDFPRYHQYCNDEIQYFGKTAKRLLLHMPLEKTAEALVDKHWRYLIQHTLGCIGTLKIWLMDAYSYALDANETTLTKEHLDATVISGRQVDIKRLSIEEGERKMAVILSDGNIGNREEFNNKTNVNKSKPKGKSFQRNAKRDKVNVDIKQTV